MVEFCLVGPSSYGSIPANKRMLVRGVRKWKFAASTRVRVISQMAPFFSLLFLFFRDDLHLPLSIMAQNWQRLASTRTYIRALGCFSFPPPIRVFFRGGKSGECCSLLHGFRNFRLATSSSSSPALLGLSEFPEYFLSSAPSTFLCTSASTDHLKQKSSLENCNCNAMLKNTLLHVVNRFFLDEKLK